MIHLVAGESALRTLKLTSVPGEKFSIDDILMEGPILNGLRSESSWDVRADYLERRFSIPKAAYLSGKAERDRVLDDSLLHDEIVLWFEFDLFCQANLLYYLDWYAARDLGATRLMLICPEKVAGRAIFRGLGELHSDELESLFPNRAEVTAPLKKLAQLAWEAYGGDDPGAIETLLQSETSAMPTLAPALRSHLRRFPSTMNGLGILGQKTLEILAGKPADFHSLFRDVTNSPDIFRFGIGDLSFQAYIDMWASGPSPLVRDDGVVEITEAGRDVIANHADAIQLNGIDVWYGGVHVTDADQWRWDPAQQKLRCAGE